MHNYRLSIPTICLETERVLIRTTTERDAYLLADYYSENRAYLQPWEPKRDKTYCHPSSWQVRLSMIQQQQAQGNLFYFMLMDPAQSETIGIVNFSNLIRGDFHACYLGYSIGERWQGQGLMYEALQTAIGYMFNRQHIHRIMANYMPHNQRSGALLERLGFQREGYAKDYLMIDGQWQDHILMSLTNTNWTPTT